MRWHYRSQSQTYGAARPDRPRTEKVIEMTETQPHGNPVTRVRKDCDPLRPEHQRRTDRRGRSHGAF